MECKTNEDAQKATDENNEKGMDQFCPVIKEMCRRDCACCFDGTVQNNGATQTENRRFYPGFPYCSSPLVTGEINVNNQY